MRMAAPRTVKATCPGLTCFKPSLREINLQLGGKIEETRTMLQAAISAFLRASSKLESLSRCLPTPLVRKIFLVTNDIVPACRASVSGLSARNLPLWKSNKKVLHGQRISDAKTRQEQQNGEWQMTISGEGEESFSRDVVEQLAERLAERQNFSEVPSGEVGA